MTEPRPNLPKLVIFDLDGTLVDAFTDIALAASHILALNGLPPITVDEVKPHVGRGARVLVAGILATTDEAIIEPNYQKLVEYYSAQNQTHSQYYPGVIDAVRRLRDAGITTAIATNKPLAVTTRVLAALGHANLFSHVVGESDQFPSKPDPHMLNHLMSVANATFAETIMVGDTTIDAQFGQAAGVQVIGVTYGQMSADQLRSAGVEVIIDSMSQLPATIGLPEA